MDELSNWYVRRSRRRFWKGEDDLDKKAAHSTLYECLVAVAKLTAPFTPFMAEAIYQNLVVNVDSEAPESVHLADWPERTRCRPREDLVSAWRPRGGSWASAGRPATHRPSRPASRCGRSSWRRDARDAVFEEGVLSLRDIVLDELNVKELHFAEPGDVLATISSPTSAS